MISQGGKSMDIREYMGVAMPITLTFHIFGYTVTITVKSRDRHSAK